MEKKGLWEPNFQQEDAKEYLNKIQRKGEYPNQQRGIRMAEDLMEKTLNQEEIWWIQRAKSTGSKKAIRTLNIFT